MVGRRASRRGVLSGWRAALALWAVSTLLPAATPAPTRAPTRAEANPEFLSVEVQTLTIAGLRLEGVALSLAPPVPGGQAILHAARMEALSANLDPRLAALLPASDVRLACRAFSITGEALQCRNGELSLNLGPERVTFALEADAGRERLALSVVAPSLNVEGTSVAQGVALAAGIEATQRSGHWAYDVSVEMRSGLAYVEPGIPFRGNQPGFLLEVTDPSAPIRLQARLRAREGAVVGLEVDDFLLQHPGVLECTGGIGWRDGQADWVRASCEVPSLPEAYRVWLAPILVGSALATLDTAGAMQMDFSYADGVLNHAVVGFEHVFVDDRAGRFSLSDLDGNFILHSGPDIQRSRLGLLGGELLGLPVGASTLSFESQSQRMRLASGSAIPFVGGAFIFSQFDVTAPGLSGNRLQIAGALTPIAIADLCAILACPAFEGTLAFEVPALTLTNGQLTLDGTLQADIFDGQVLVSEFHIIDLLSRVPRLYADVTARNINLEKLTSATAFGRIEGSVDVWLEGLELANWSPVAFDFRLASVEDDSRPHRISRRAVDNIGELGAGSVSPLSAGALKFIDAYSYGRLAVGCTFRAGACWLSGIDGSEGSQGGGFRILSPGGWLPPWIEIRGSGRLLPIEIIQDGYQRIREGNVQVRLNE